MLMPLSSGIAVCAGSTVQVGATWAKSAVRSPKSGLEMSSQSGQDRQVWQISSVLLSELWELLGNRRAAAQNQVKSKVKVYLSDKSYD